MARSEPDAVVGLDLSLTATGVARFDYIGGDGMRVWTVKSKGKKTDTLQQRAYRLDDLATEIIVTIPSYADVVLETPAHNQVSGHHHDRSGLWWIVADRLIQADHNVYEIATTSVKKYATGKGNASKMEVMAAAIKRYPELDIANDNEADGVILAAMLSRLLGRPIEESLPQVNLDAMKVLSQSETA